MPWYELRVRGRLESSSGLVSGFQVVEQMVTTVLCGRVDKTVGIQPVLADVQALGLEVMEFHQVPQRPSPPPALRVGRSAEGARSKPVRLEVVLLDVPDERLPSSVVRAISSLAKDELTEIVEVARVERLADGTLGRRKATSSFPTRVAWQLRRTSDSMVPLHSLAASLERVRIGESVLLVALLRRSPADRLAAAAALAGGSLVTSVELPFEGEQSPGARPAG